MPAQYYRRNNLNSSTCLSIIIVGPLHAIINRLLTILYFLIT